MAAPLTHLTAHAGPRSVAGEAAGPARASGVRPPAPEECAPVWDQPVPGSPSSVVWFLGAHGGAGASTLAHVISRTGDAGGRWPGGHGQQSPFVVIVAEESVMGLSKAHALVRQHASGGAGQAAQLLGMVTVARVPGKRPQAVRQQREVATALVDQHWSIPFIPSMNEYYLNELAVWQWGDGPASKKRMSPVEAVPAPIATFGAELVDLIKARVAAGHFQG